VASICGEIPNKSGVGMAKTVPLNVSPMTLSGTEGKIAGAEAAEIWRGDPVLTLEWAVFVGTTIAADSVKPAVLVLGTVEVARNLTMAVAGLLITCTRIGGGPINGRYGTAACATAPNATNVASDFNDAIPKFTGRFIVNGGNQPPPASSEIFAGT